MSRALWLADVLTDAGLTIKPFAGWETRGRDDFAPVGVILHHTATRPTASDATVDRILAVTGSSVVSAPLCQYSTNRNGTVSVIAAGTANHGGVGRWNGVAGNKFWFGDEMKNLGTSAEPWPAIQLESAFRAAAAILTHLDRDASWVCGHKEYATPPGRKIDPHTLSMATVRATIAAMMEDDMPLDEVRQIVREELDRRRDGRLGPLNETRGIAENIAGYPDDRNSNRQLALRTNAGVNLLIGAVATEEDIDEVVALIKDLPTDVVDEIKARL